MALSTVTGMTVPEINVTGGALSLQMFAKGADVEGSTALDVLVNIVPPEGERTPVHICCVVDISGSMSSSADDGKTGTEQTGLSILDITKHAVKTILHILGPNDLASLVAYTDNARVIFESEPVTDDNRKELIKKLETLAPEASTNIWAGVESGIQTIRRGQESYPTKSASVILLTDGLPNIRPPRGEVAMMKKLLDKYPDLHLTMNTIGFGYNLDSPLLIDLAKTGHGTYMFIPDSGLVGTVFVNLVSNLLSTMSSTCTVSLEPANGATITKAIGPYGGTGLQSWGWQGQIGALNYGQSRGVVVQMDAPVKPGETFLEVTVEYMPRGGTAPVKLTGELSVSSDDHAAVIAADKLRLEAAEVIFNAMGLVQSPNKHMDYDKLPVSQDLVATFVERMANSPFVAGNEQLVDLQTDVTGQVTEAFSKKEWFTKWGRHYLPSLGRAHLLQQCNNFKDPGVQHYGGSLYEKIRENADEIFISLPAPKPSRVASSRSSYSSHSVKSAPVNMRSYYSCSNPCFDGGNLTEMADGTMKLVRDLKKGDLVRTPEGSAAIRCVVKTLVGPSTELVQLDSGLLLTPWHPVKYKGKWTFPATLKPITERECDAVYSFILDQHHSMFIEGTEAVSLGHNFTDNEIIRHPYFGSQAIIQDLQKFNGFEEGIVVFNNECLERDSKTGLLYKFKSSKQVLAL